VFAIALLAVALAEYIGELLAPLHDSTGMLAALLIVALTALNLHGVRTASGTQQLTSLVKLVALWALAVACLLLAHPARSHSSALAAASPALVTGAGIIASFQLVLGAYNGWAAPAYFGGEAVDTRHGIARSLVYGALLVSATYIAVNAAILYVVPPVELMNSKLPAAAALERLTSTHGLRAGVGGMLFVAVAVLSLPSTLQAVMMQTSRTLHAMSTDGLFLRWGSQVNLRGSPANATFICGAVAILLALTSSFEALFITFTAFAVLNNLILLCGVIRLRRSEPDLPRPFKMVGYPWALIPIVLVDLIVFYGFAGANLRQCLLSVALVAAFYFYCRLRRRQQGGG
jgi:basic amino acid/polyamine antiporter, APA family